MGARAAVWAPSGAPSTPPSGAPIFFITIGPVKSPFLAFWGPFKSDFRFQDLAKNTSQKSLCNSGSPPRQKVCASAPGKKFVQRCFVRFAQQSLAIASLRAPKKGCPTVVCALGKKVCASAALCPQKKVCATTLRAGQQIVQQLFCAPETVHATTVCSLGNKSVHQLTCVP